MNIELLSFKTGHIMLAADASHPDIVKRVEYYSDQKLFLIVYKNTSFESDLMHFEVPAHMITHVEKSPEVIIYTMFDGAEPVAYPVPLIRIGL